MDPNRLMTSRRSLHRKAASLSNYQTKPITKHYDLNQQILAAFDLNYEQQNYPVAYALGIQFVETALIEIPKHGYFYSQRHERERMQSAIETVRVSQTLRELEALGEVQVPPAAQWRVERLTGLALEQVEQASNDQANWTGRPGGMYEIHRAETEAEFKQLEMEEEQWVCEPLLACAESLSGFIFPPTEAARRQSSSQYSINPIPPPPPMMQSSFENSRQDSGALSLLGDDESEVPVSVSLVPTAECVPITRTNTPNGWVTEPPPSSQTTEVVRGTVVAVEPPDLIRARQSAASIDSVENELEKALFLSGLEVSSRHLFSPNEDEEEGNSGGKKKSSSDSHNPRKRSMRASQRLEFTTLRDLYHDDFFALMQFGRVRISYADTFQGRLPESTNGCTVIAPLLCIHHLVEISDPHQPDPGLTDFAIEQVIDLETPSILTQLRSELQLSEQAFLIPSDAHDYLIQNGQLSQQQFLTVLGGNILDESHLIAFVESLRDEAGIHQKMAATLYFHEHVVSILQLRRSPTVAWYDVIDSLPSKEFLRRPEESEYDFNQRSGLPQTEEEFTRRTVQKTIRIRCLDVEALMTCLRWYACSKFSEENIQYIDQYAWDENSCDFDPRVFQGFVWTDQQA